MIGSSSADFDEHFVTLISEGSFRDSLRLGRSVPGGVTIFVAAVSDSFQESRPLTKSARGGATAFGEVAFASFQGFPRRARSARGGEKNGTKEFFRRSLTSRLQNPSPPKS